jgi:HK97 family phage portal protein
VQDVQTAIALEILAEKFGATFFQNGAVPFLVFKFMQGSAGFRTKEEEAAFIQAFQDALGGSKRFRAMLVPKGIDEPKPIPIENDKAQFLETRKYQRTVIAGAFGVPPHLVGDLERATFNNVEQQDSDFTLNVVMPVCQAFEAAMERDLLTDEDRRSGVCIRFNLDSVLRADFKSRQEGLKIQREMGVISPNEWREIEGKNPREGGDDYWQQGPSGQGGAEETNDETESDSTPGTEAA